MKCEYCGKKIGKGRTKYCSNICGLKDYSEKYYHNICKCGNKKYYTAKRCRKCYASNKTRGQLSRLK